MGRGDPVEGYLLSMCDDFVLLAVATSFYIVRYPFAHSYPIVRLACFSDCFISSRMSGCGVIVYEGHQLSFSCFGGY